jgi:hypothetical protein
MGEFVDLAMVALGYRRGLRRWHFFGDEEPGKWNPHLNILVDGGYLPHEELESIKDFLRAVVGEPELIVHYKYKRCTGQKLQNLEYVTRATFKVRAWDEEMAAELYGFRNTWSWGKWEGEPVWGKDDLSPELQALVKVEKLRKRECPECGEPLTWGDVGEAGWLEAWAAEPIAAGYYRLPDGDPTRSPPMDKNKVKADRRRREAVKKWIRKTWLRPYIVGPISAKRLVDDG